MNAPCPPRSLVFPCHSVPLTDLSQEYPDHLRVKIFSALLNDVIYDISELKNDSLFRTETNIEIEIMSKSKFAFHHKNNSDKAFVTKGEKYNFQIELIKNGQVQKGLTKKIFKPLFIMPGEEFNIEIEIPLERFIYSYDEYSVRVK